jgi:hypothetical protein
MTPNDSFHYREIAALFKQASQELEARIASFVYNKILQYPL